MEQHSFDSRLKRAPILVEQKRNRKQAYYLMSAGAIAILLVWLVIPALFGYNGLTGEAIEYGASY